MRFTRALVATLVGLVVPASLAQTTLNHPLPDPVPYRVVGESLDNPFPEARTLHEEVVLVEDAAWLRVYFGEEVVLGEGSLLRISSELDGDVQELDAAALESWHHSSAYFNGGIVRIELIGGPGTRGNRLVIDRLAWEIEPAIPVGGCGICGGELARNPPRGRGVDAGDRRAVLGPIVAQQFGQRLEPIDQRCEASEVDEIFFE